MSRDRVFAGLCTSFLAGITAGILIADLSKPVFRPFLATLSLIPVLLSAIRHSKSGRINTIQAAAVFALTGAFCSLAGHGSPVLSSSLTDRAASAFRSIIDSVPWPSDTTGPLVKALLTGDRSGLPKDIVSIFRRSGASHILALSGLHLGIIYLILSKTLSVLGRFPAAYVIRYILILVISAFYTIMTGASPSLVRAFLFIVIRETGLLLSRPRRPLRILLTAMLIQLSISPSTIMSAGFQLSYLAMAGITVLHPKLLAIWPDAGSRNGGRSLQAKIWNAASLSISCQAFTAPLAWLRFRSFPPYFLITNLLALPLTSIAITLAVATLSLSATGLCPELLVKVTDKAVSTLVFILRVISDI